MAEKKNRKAYQLKVTLKAVRPPVWRRVVVPGAFCLDELHWVIQFAMGWTNSHLHQFVVKAPVESPTPAELRRMMTSRDFSALGGPAMRGERIFTDLSTADGLGDGEDETRIRLDQIAPAEKAKFRYDYDFGDGWEHDVLVEKITPRDPSVTYPRCLGGKRNCPPEDCGGPWGYADLLDAIADPSHERHAELKEWLGDDFDPERFDLDAVNAAFDDVTRDG
jgi:hypothetical protein